MNLLETLVGALETCADDLAMEVEARYSGTKDHPAVRNRYERDMEPVVAARTALAEAERWEAVEACVERRGRGDIPIRVWPGDEPSAVDTPALLLIQKDASHD